MTIPLATYRLQLHGGFTMFDAAGLAEYLAALGVSHAYLSPILQAAAGSQHGYDCVDPERIDSERGGAEGFVALRSACRGAGLGLVVDIVPNHLDISGSGNRWWRSVLRLGSQSEFARVFDVDWELTLGQGGGIALPILGEDVEEALAAGRLELKRDGGWMDVCYFEHRLPLSAGTCAEVLRGAAARLGGSAQERLTEIAGDLKALGAGDGDASSPDDEADRLEARLEEALGEGSAAAAAVDEELAAVSASPERLRRVLARQHYRLVFWQETAREIGYRRFFDINTLVGVRVEDPAVFERTHRLILELMGRGEVDGLRVDHPDGLRDPAGYFQRLASAAPGAWVVAEKILEADEKLRDWPVAGTTGYEFLNDVLGLLVDPEAGDALRALYEEVAGRSDSYGEVAFESKLSAARKLLGADLARLTRLLVHLSKVQDRLRLERGQLREAVALLAACMPVYRTYIVPEAAKAGTVDAEHVWTARGHAERRRPELAPEPLAAIRDLLLLELRSPSAADARSLESEFVARFQQYSAPAMAKGVEDTAFYRYLAFVALNEVGGDPARFGLRPGRFHARNAERAQRWPASMLSTSTHDTKRSEDVRARLAVLSEMPEAWGEAVRRWMRLNESRREERGGAPDRRAEYLLYQTLVGAWPIDADRVVAYMRKAAREEKVRTSWLEVNEKYEGALESFVRRVLENRAFTDELSVFVLRLLRPGRVNSLVQVLLKLTCPGVPDIYQGCELWDLSLVDPDNRRPVDWELRKRLLREVETMSSAEVWSTLEERDDPGRAKLWLTMRGLRERRRWAAAFGERSSYTPVFVTGRWEDRIAAFVRGDDDGPRVVVIVPRLTNGSGGAGGSDAGGAGGARSAWDWDDTAVTLPPPAERSEWVNVLGEARVGPGERAVSEVLAGAPMALLVEEAS